MADLSGLPDAVVKQIIQRARSCFISGTNKFARVCRQWQEVSVSSSNSGPGLQLFMGLRHMSAEELQNALGWTAMHGQAVATLVMDASMKQAKRLQWFLQAAPALSSLSRLEVGGEDSLVYVAPVLGQLPQLQHLAAHVSVAASLGYRPSYAPPPQGYFVYGASSKTNHPWDKAPDLEQLCPQLTSLRLTVDPDPNNWDVGVDVRLPRLLPARLKQLSLVTEGAEYGMWLHSSSLVHLSALQQLTVANIHLVARSSEELGEHLWALQQLQEVWLDHRQWYFNIYAWGVLRVAPRIRQLVLDVARDCGLVQALSQTVHLTQLTLGLYDAAIPQGLAGALAALTGLRELSLGCFRNTRVVPLVQQAAGMPNLRSLQLLHFVPLQAVSASLQQCTQLTSLVVVSEKGQAGDDVGVAALQQLTGLRCLTVPPHLLEQAGGTWLAPLTALTRLCVQRLGMYVSEADRRRWDEEDEPVAGGVAAEAEPGPIAMAQQLRQQVQAWPASLQQVVVLYDLQLDEDFFHSTRFKPECWQFNSAAPGGGQFSVWLEEDAESHEDVIDMAPGWARPFSPCPHLQGVWELQGEVAGSNG